MERIDINVFHLPGSVISNVAKCYLELSSDRLAYVHDYDVNLPEDEDNPEENFRVLDKVVYKKEAIIGASLSSRVMRAEGDEGEEDETMNCYAVAIPVANVDETIEVMFETLKEANAFHKKICDYIFN
jgi:hypothetical protein